MEREFISRRKAISMMPKGDEVHVMTNPAPSVMFGIDVERQNIIGKMERGRIELAGEAATSTGHGLAVWVESEGRYLFVETRT